MKFQVVSDYKPMGDQPQAIEKLAKGIINEEKYQTLLGVTGSESVYGSQCDSGSAATNFGFGAQQNAGRPVIFRVQTILS